MFVYLLVLVESYKVAVVPQSSPYNEDGLAAFLRTITGAPTDVQKFVGEYEGIEEYSPDLVLIYTESIFELQTVVRWVPTSAVIRYSDVDLRPACSNAAPLREVPWSKWEELASKVTEFFDWSRVLVVHTIEASAKLSQAFRGPRFEKINFRSDIEESAADLLVTRIIRASGNRSIFLVAGTQATEVMLGSLAKYRMDKGYSIVLIGTNCQFDVSLYPTGLLCLALRGTETAKTEAEVDYWYAYYALTFTPLETWAIINVVQGQKLKVGLIDKDSVEFSSSVVYPGGLKTPPDNSPLQVKLGLAGMNNPTASDKQYTAYLALEDYPLTTKSFVVSLTPLDVCGEGGYLDCYLSVQSQSISALLHNSYGYSPLLGLLQWQQTNNLRTPMINTSSIEPELSSTEEFPNIVILAQTNEYFLLLNALAFKRLKYDKVTIFCAFEDQLGVEFEAERLALSGIETVNPYSDFSNEDASDTEYYTRVAESLKRAAARPIQNYLSSEEWVEKYLPAFREAGLGKGDTVMFNFAKTYLGFTQLYPDKPEALDLIADFSDIIKIDFVYFKGSLGQHLKQEFKERAYQPSASNCAVYDSAAHASTAIDLAIKRGLNFYDWSEMMRAIRLVRTAGCSGQISFSLEHNHMKDLDLSVEQSQVVDGQLVDVTVFTVSLTGSSTYTALNDFEWANGTPDIPLQSRLNPKDCPFPEEYRRDSEASQRLAVEIVMGLFGVTVLVAVAAYFAVHRGRGVNPMTAPILLGTQDMILAASAFFEVLMIGLLTPTAGPVNFFTLGFVSNSLLAGIDLTDGSLFNVLNAVYFFLSVGAFVTFVCALNKFRPCTVDIQPLAVVITRPFFVTGVFLLFSVYDCSEAAAATDDYDLQDSFMDVDCFETCWEGRHLRYSVASAVLFVVFVLVSIPLSPSLNNSLEGLQFETSPAFLLIRMPVLTLLIALLKASAFLSSAAYSALYLSILGLYLLVCWRVKVLAIPTYDFLHSLCLLALIVLALCQTLYEQVFPNALAWLLIGLFTILVIAGFGLLKYRRLPKLTLKPPVIDVDALFRFAFRPNVLYDPAQIRRKAYEVEDLVSGDRVQ
jgi:hypothetical protein